MAPDRHNFQQHRSEDSTGADIAVDKVPVSDGVGGWTFEDFAAASAAGYDTYQDHGNTGSTETFDVSVAHHHRAVLDAATVTFTFTGAVAAQSWSMVLELVQDATGGRLVSWPGSVIWDDGTAPVLSTTASAVDFYTFVSHDGGTTWFGFEGSSLQDHDHSSAGAQGGATLSPGTLNLPTASSPSQTADGRVVWDSDDDKLTIGTGSTRKTMVNEGAVTTSGLTQATGKLLGRSTASTGAIEEITVGTNLTLSAGTLSASGGSGIGPILISDTPSTPLVFADLIQNEAQDDLVYADP